MKKMQGLILAAMVLASGYSASLRAEDVDIYVGGAATTGTPNVLLVLDNAANFEASAENCTYVDGTAPSLNGTAGGVEQCAIYNVVSSLPAGAVNLGLMVYNAGNIRDINGANCGGSNGGCLMVPLTEMTAANKAAFLTWVKTWRTSGSAGPGYIKANGEATGAAMQEAWAYYAGRTGLSGRSYASVQPPAGCQKNFVIFVGNAFTPSGSPGDGGSASPMAALNTAPGITAELKAPITIPSRSYGTSSFSCGSYTMGNHTDSSGLFADEWARYMNRTDLYAAFDSTQSITTYTVGLLGPSCKPDYPALLSSMASHGGGKYFPTSSYEEIATALMKILNEVQAVNSVFSSASLPVSVNADGTYLNQIFLGMFRPDPAGLPRWMGNLKQYQLVKNASGKFVMGDANSHEAISSSGTGFIDPNAVSIWSSKNTLTAPDNGGGFWVNEPKGVPQSGYDSPDGEVVEKGGVAQQLRLENLTADFSSAEYSSTNPRRLYTYCPSGSGCVASLTDASNAFSTGNAGISAAAFGASSAVRITSIVRNGTTATVTTAENHGFTTPTSVTISGADQPEYNVTQTVSGAGNTFTISGLPDHPRSPAQGAYTLAKVDAASQVTLSSLSYDAATGLVTARTSLPHGFAAGSTIAIQGAVPNDFNGQYVVAVPVATCPDLACFTYARSQNPPSPATNGYQIVVAPPASAINVSKVAKTGGKILVDTSAPHGFHQGQKINITGTSVVAGAWTVVSVGSDKQFEINASGNPSCNASCGSVEASTTPEPITALTRSGTTAAAQVATAYLFGRAAGDKKTVNITLKTDNGGVNESGYVISNATITCTVAGCSQFTYTVPVSPPSGDAGGTITAGPPSATSASIAAGRIDRVGTSNNTVRVRSVPANVFATGDRVTLSPLGTSYANESAYAARTWTVSCSVADCSELTFDEPVPLSPAASATGNMKAYSGSTPPDKNTLIRWLRGADNYGDEKGPGGSVKVRPSIHGDVLHSRPVVLNYGGNTESLVAFYGANDGVFRAVNANKSQAIGSVPAGGELWGLILPEHFPSLNRLRVNTPEVRFTGTVLPNAQPKDYYVDGPTGVYQKLKADKTIDEAFIYLAMRRGGNFLYAIDVSDPVSPQVKWRISAGDAGFEELGQTWSRPRLTLINGLPGTTSPDTPPTPVLVFGAGYDTAQDSEPPAGDTMGRGIYIVNAKTGELIWSATRSCTTSATCKNVANMNYAIASDITFVDRNFDGLTDTLYFGDLGGNIWRAHVSSTDKADWKVERLAALGCDAGACTSGNPRKIFFPPAVLSIGKAGTPGAYDLVSVASGDREHPLRTHASYNVSDKFFVLIDRTAAGPTPTPTVNVAKTDLDDATSSEFTYSDSKKGFFITFARGEKGVNAPNVVNGIVFFSTNRPIDPANTCSANLGEAKGYAVNPFTAFKTSSVLAGGGLPPSSVSGVVNVTTRNEDGTETTTQEKFCIGCAMNCTGNECSPLQNTPPAITIDKKLRRTYWYKK
ncbi:PilC/PilY family type IV pilus protein [Ramlibacter tataouinensis]|uniref:PilC/PilY family type IV pilus protein n=1 Tax=Ramlibacter tataouinensis TaxID=94132 RepID=UPI0022F3D449|nr:PilC/PilY family type IV pilus protein [Ramlibacter tataouinensis]WBY01581.1 PilC/PilY family type IV pilus protein [Ramlibacter tataouinensis]